ncbi:MAG: pseudouridine synthase [bacterium]
MRINKYIAQATGFSRRAVDTMIDECTITVNGAVAVRGQEVDESDQVVVNGKLVTPQSSLTILVNKPFGYVCSKNGQGSKTIYELLPEKYQHLKTVGRLDKNSSGIILLTSDGDLAYELTHPSKVKLKRYEIALDRPLQPLHQQIIQEPGVQLEDGLSRLRLAKLDDDGIKWEVVMHEGRNRQIRRTFESLGYSVMKLHRTNFGNYKLGELKSGHIKEI